MNFSKHNHTRTPRFTWKSFLFEEKTTRQISNNFIILNRNYNTERYNLSKEKTLFFFSFIALIFTVYLSQFSLNLSIFRFFFAYSQSCSSSRLHCSQSHLLKKLYSHPMDQVTCLSFH